VTGNKDKELDDPKGYGLIEYAYYKMALDAGVEMPECRILEENDRSHFMARRFDRTDTGHKLHMLSLGAMAHYDYNQAGAHSYEQAFRVMQQLDLPMASIEQQFTRMAFNIVARNQDDHVKNIAFLMERDGSWSLSPAFDVTYSYNPEGLWTGAHQMSLNGKRDDFTADDFVTCANNISMKRGRAEEILKKVQANVLEWTRYAGVAGVPDDTAARIGSTHRTGMIA
jgi:serine/threonine-protein kinase HipA